MSELLDLLRPGSTEHESLTIGSNLFENLLDLRFESHVQHPVGFVHDEVGNTTQVGLSRLEHIDQSSRSGNNDFGTSLEITNLSSLGDSSVDAGVSNSGRRTELGALLLNLDGEFSSGGDDEDDGSISGGKESLGVDVNDGRESESNGLS